MAIPRIDTYEMPAPEALPQNRVRWTPSARRAVLLVHDLQDYFLGFYDAARSPIPELLYNAQRLALRARELGIPVVYTAQPAEQSARERALLNDMWGPGITQAPNEASIVAALRPRTGDHVFAKWRYSAFQRSGLLDALRHWKRDQLIVTGIYAHIGCLTTASEAFMSDVQPFLVADAVADFSRAKHDMALTYVAGCCGSVTTTHDVLAAFDSENGTEAVALGAGPARSNEALYDERASS